MHPVCPFNVAISFIDVVFHNLIVVSHEPEANISLVYTNNVWIKSEWPDVRVEYVWNESFVILIELSSKLLANLDPSFKLANVKLIPNGCIISDLHANEFVFEHVHKYSRLFGSNCLHPSHGKFQQL